MDEAIVELTRALQITPENIETYHQLRIGYGRKGEYDRAFELFEIVLRIDPTSEPAQKNLAMARVLRSSTPEATASSRQLNACCV